MSEITVAQLGELIAQANTGRVNRENLQAYLQNPDRCVAGADKPILRLISDQPIVIPPADGSEILAEAGDLFTGYINPDFRNWKADEPGATTRETEVQVYEQVKDVTLAQMFGSLSLDPAKLCLTQAQIKAFVKQHRNWLRTGSYVTFFLFRSYNHFFAARVLIHGDGKLHVYVYRFESADVWYAAYRHRVVAPQLA